MNYKRDLKNIKILCDFICGELDEEGGMKLLDLPQRTKRLQENYVKKLFRIIRDEQARQKAMASSAQPSKDSSHSSLDSPSLKRLMNTPPKDIK